MSTSTTTTADDGHELEPITRAADVVAPDYAMPDLDHLTGGSDGQGAEHLADVVREVYGQGADAARSAATWTTDGNGDPLHYSRTLRALEDGDPVASDALPLPNLSGEWSGDPTPDDLADVETSPHVARMTGAAWTVVRVDGLQVGPYYDDVEDAERVAADIRSVLADAWEAGRDAVLEDACAAELLAACPDPAERARALVDARAGDVDAAVADLAALDVASAERVRIGRALEDIRR